MTTQQLYASLEQALIKFQETTHFPLTDALKEPLKEATIQRFEYTFELSWKLMSSILKDEGMEEYGFKNIIRAAHRLDLIGDVELWFTYAKARNESSHIYHQDVAIA